MMENDFLTNSAKVSESCIASPVEKKIDPAYHLSPFDRLLTQAADDRYVWITVFDIFNPFAR